MAKAIDWTSIRQAYITTPTASLRELAKRYGVSASAVMSRSSREKWPEQREQLQREAEAEAQRHATRARARAIEGEAERWRRERAEEIAAVRRGIVGALRGEAADGPGRIPLSAVRVSLADLPKLIELEGRLTGSLADAKADMVEMYAELVRSVGAEVRPHHRAGAEAESSENGAAAVREEADARS